MTTVDGRDSAGGELPVWDLTPFFPGLESPEYRAAVDALGERIEELVARFDELEIGEGWAGDDPAAAAVFDEALAAFNAVLDEFEYLGAYVFAILTIDTRDESAQVRATELERIGLPLTDLGTRLTAWVGERNLDALLAASGQAREHEHFVRTSAIDARHLLSPAEESLVAELDLSSGSAWSRMYEAVTAQIEAPVTIDGEARTVTMPELRLLAFDERAETRRAAYEAELAAWQRHDVPIAAALNGIKGQATTLDERRRWPSSLDLALHRNAIDRDVLDAMVAAAEERFPAIRRYFRAKAALLGRERLPWYDLFAPVGESSRAWTYDDSLAIIEDAFARFSPRLRAMAQQATEEAWIDARPRLGKRDGAYCMPVRDDVSRVFTNFTASYGGLSTLAHELGHAYHNVCLAGRTAIQRATPSTLAETASTFCETVVRHAALTDASPADELVILEGVLQDASQVVVDIASRLRFEQALFAARAESEVPPSQLCRLMLDAQRATYGDGLDDDLLHPYMWAAKGHYYSVGEGFYNFPYMFGLLFSLGLYARFQAEPAGFAARYDDLLSSTGMATAVDLAARFSIDLRTPDFWRSSLDLVEADITRYTTLASDLHPSAQPPAS